jgi:hypothetical protein
MELIDPLRPLTALGQGLPLANVVTFRDQQRSIEAVGAEVLLIVLDDDKVAISLESTAGVSHLPRRRGAHGITRSAGDPQTLVGAIPGAKILTNGTVEGPSPGET